MKREITRVMAEESVDYFTARRKMTDTCPNRGEGSSHHGNPLDPGNFPSLRRGSPLNKSKPAATFSRRVGTDNDPIASISTYPQEINSLGNSYSQVTSIQKTSDLFVNKLSVKDRITWNNINDRLLAATDLSSLLVELEKKLISLEIKNVDNSKIGAMSTEKESEANPVFVEVQEMIIG